MGIHGIYKEIGKGERIALSKLAVRTLEEKGRPLRLAIDISIWLFQIQSSKGGTNPALRTFYYRLLRLISLSVQPLFVFDGPNKPPFKRNKRTGPNVASVPEFLAKQLLKQFGLTFHMAPGEAEAECALLQREGIVDAVLSEDVDTLMFGSKLTLRSWSAEPGTGTKVTTHVNLYDAEKTRNGPSGLDSDGMILVAMMSGGDYTPEGIPGCGPKTACEAARAGFGTDLCRMSRKNKVQRKIWRERLQEELRENKSGFFRQRHKKLEIPEEFPREDILFYYTNPVISNAEQLQKLRDSLQFDQPLDFKALRTFCGEAFDWRCISGAKKFVRNLAPALLVRELRLRAAQNSSSDDNRSADDKLEEEKKYILGIHGKRNHKSTDETTELRVSYAPMKLVDIDLDAEDPDPEIATLPPDSDDEELAGPADEGEEPTSPSKRARGPYLYDPTKHEKMWMLETFAKMGTPVTVDDWEAASRRKKVAKAAAEESRQAKAKARGDKKKTKTGASAQQGALDRFTTVTKGAAEPTGDKPVDVDPFTSGPAVVIASSPPRESRAVSRDPVKAPLPTASGRLAAAFKMPPPFGLSAPEAARTTAKRSQPTVVSLLSSSPTRPAGDEALAEPKQVDAREASGKSAQPRSNQTSKDDMDMLAPSVTRRRRRTPLKRAKTVSDGHDDDMSDGMHSPSAMRFRQATTQRAERVGLDDASPDRLNQAQQPVGTPSRRSRGFAEAESNVVSLLDSSPATPRRGARQQSITEWASPSKPTAKPTAPPSAKPTSKLPAVAEEAQPRRAKATFVEPRSWNEVAELLDDAAVLRPKEPPARPKRGTVRVRESLQGSYALELDSPQKPDAKRSRTFRLSQIQTCDLTEEL